MKKILIFAALFAALAFPAGAQEQKPDDNNEFRAASVFSDHMVLQRETLAPVWGWAEPGAAVTVATSWNKAKSSCVAGKDGRWEVKVATPAAGGPYSLTISTKGKDKIVLNDVMSGEVWLCTGQSNMQMPVKGFSMQAVDGAIENVLEAQACSGKVRVYDIQAGKAFEPQEDLPYSWTLSSPEVAANTSAVAYLFAKRLAVNLDVTIGIITCPWGGCMIEPWISQEYLDKDVKDKITEGQYNTIMKRKEDAKSSPKQVATMYNARMYPVKGYALRGFLWYQGCSNLGHFTFYDKLQTAMVDCWRNMWGDTKNELPFYFTTIAPYSYDNSQAETRAFFVENQLASLDEIPNSAAAITETLGEEGSIHPAKKQEVADQFALLAMEKIYGVKTGIGSGFPYPKLVIFPANSSVNAGKIRQSGFDVELRKSEAADGSVRINFANAGSGLGHIAGDGCAVMGFEVAGPDKVFHSVPAKALWDHVYLDCSEIPDPVAVRYAFHNYCESDLTSAIGIPVPSFRTDNWSAK